MATILEPRQHAAEETVPVIRDRRNGDVQKQLAIVVAVLGLVAAIFTAGVNWGRIETLHAWKDLHQEDERREHGELVRKDVAAVEYAVLRAEIQSLRESINRLAAVQGAQSSRRAEP